MSRRVAVTVSALTLLTGAVLGAATSGGSASGAAVTSVLHPFDAVDPVPTPVPMPEMLPLEPGPVAMPQVEPHGRPVPIPLVGPDSSAGPVVPQELRRAR